MSVELLIIAGTLLISPLVMFALSWGAARIAMGRGARVRNYRGIEVSLGLGWAWVPPSLLWLGYAARQIVTGADAGGNARSSAAAAAFVLACAFLGWLDDRFGTGESRGIRGHLRALREGRVTTGLVKMVGIGAAALVAGRYVPYVAMQDGPRLVVWLSAAAMLAGTANLLNLLDLRPGRALKVYGLLCVAAVVLRESVLAGDDVAALGFLLALAIALPLLAPAAAVWRADLGERGMLGDMGANAAGAMAGTALVTALPTVWLVVAAIVVVGLNLTSERVSFSAVIERNAVLRRLDALGRVKAEGRGQADEAV